MGFNYKCVSIEEGGQSLKMRAVCLQTLTGLGAMIGDISERCDMSLIKETQTQNTHTSGARLNDQVMQSTQN